MKRQRFRTLFALLLALSLVLGQAAPALAWEIRETNYFSRFPRELDFNTLDYGTPSLDGMERISQELKAAAQREGNLRRVASLLADLTVEYSRFNTNYAVFYVAYCNDPNALSDAYSAWDSASNRVENIYVEAVQSVLASPSKAVVVQALGEEDAEYRAGQDVDTPEQLALLDQCSDLVNQYWSKAGMETPVQFQDATYRNTDDAFNAYAQGTLSLDDYYSITTEMYKAVNAEVGPIFVKLVDLRNQYARSKGQNSFAEYTYSAYFGRDYTPADAAAVHESVKQYLVPLSQTFQPLSYGNEAISSGYQTVGRLFADAGQEEVLDMVEPYMGYISSEFADLFAYMRRCNLIDIGPSDTKNNAGFTIGLADYGSAVIFNKPDGSYYDAQTVIHEFGHFAESCLSNGRDSGMSFDVAEINSQGLELLYLPFIDDMVGAEGAANYRFEVFYQMITSGVIMGCVRDEFLQRVYAEPDLTLDKVNRIYHEVSEEYGIAREGQTAAYDWYIVHHDFEQPFYYISYCTSALAALEILELSLTDYDAACDAYLALVEQGAGSANGFRGALQMAGLSDVFEEETVAHIASAVRDYFYGEICGVRFSDLDQSWARDDALFCAAMGLFSGGADGGFQPEATLTRAQTVSLLWRVVGAPAAAQAAPFDDVASNAWYAEAAAWAYETGLVQNSLRKPNSFSPSTPVARKDLAVFLYRMAGSPQVDNTVISDFSDGAQLTSWTADAMAWCLENGLFHGQGGGQLAPNALITRGEAASVLANLYI